MGKFLFAGALALLALVIVLWFQLKAPAEAAPVPAAVPVERAATQAPAAMPADLQKKVEQVAAAQAQPEKMASDSDEFFFKFQDVITQVATRNAMACYTGGLRRVHRNQKLKFMVKDVIKNGEVTITDVQLSPESNIDDAELIACMKQEIGKTHWHDDRLPDYTQSDMVLIRPERNVNKFGKDAMSYEGSGPDFTKDHPIKSAE